MIKNRTPEFSPHEVQWDGEKAKRIWDFYGSSEAHRDTYFGETVGPHVVRVLKRKGVFRGSQAIVDFSCGTGAIIESLLGAAPRGSVVTGYDPSPASIEAANARNLGTAGFGGAFQISSLPTDINSGSVDVLVLTEVVEHLDDDELNSIMNECRRILSNTGRLVITTPNAENLDREKVICPDCGCIFHRWQHQRNWTPELLSDLAKSFNLEPRSITKVTWGNELIHIAFKLLRRKPTGLLMIAEKAHS